MEKKNSSKIIEEEEKSSVFRFLLRILQHWKLVKIILYLFFSIDYKIR